MGLKLSQCPLTSEDVERVQEALDIDAFLAKRLGALRELALKAPPLPSHEELLRLSQHCVWEPQLSPCPKMGKAYHQGDIRL